MIKIRSKCLKLAENYDSFLLFKCLRKKYADDQLFLLESLAGPNRDKNQAVIGFNPIMNIEIYKDRFKITGLSAITAQVKKLLLSLYEISPQEELVYKISHEKEVWNILRTIESLFNVEYLGETTKIRFGYFGYIGYDAIHSIESIPYQIKDDKNIPIISFGIYQGIFNIDLQKNQSYLTINSSDGIPEDLFEQTLNLIREIKTYDQTKSLSAQLSNPPKAKSVNDSVSKKRYLQWVEKALYHIGIGDIYQIQIGHEININSDIKPYDVYQRLRQINPSPYMYYTKLNRQHIIGASPELFLRIDQDNNITMRPIAGTIKVGKTPEENALLQQQLLNDKKERAEHIMLVDLGRNDVGRVCKANSLKVDELMIIEQYSHVSHIVSNIIGEKSDQFDKYDVIAATFPAGTMTGSPKIRAMEIIEDTETSRRGIYAGSVGFIGFNGIVETALCIRTAMYNDGKYTIRASGGIVSDSTCEGEWNETISKLSATYFAITNKDLRNEDFIN